MRRKRLSAAEADNAVSVAVAKVANAGTKRDHKRATRSLYRVLLSAFSSLSTKGSLAARVLQKLQDVLDGKRDQFPILHKAEWRRVIDEDAGGMQDAREDVLFLVSGDADFVFANLQLPGNVKAAVWIRFSRRGTVLVNDAVATKGAFLKELLPTALAGTSALELARSGVSLDFADQGRVAMAWALSVIVPAWVGMSDFGVTFRFDGRRGKTHFVGLKNFMGLLDEYMVGRNMFGGANQISDWSPALTGSLPSEGTLSWQFWRASGSSDGSFSTCCSRPP
jgi:hypothetical protein